MKIVFNSEKILSVKSSGIVFAEMQSIRSCLLLALVVCAHAADAYKILVVFPMPGKSHTILGDGVVRHLAAAGHEVTYITPIPKKTWPSNVRQIDVSENFKIMDSNVLNIKALMNKEVSLSFSLVIEMMLNIHNETLLHPRVTALMEDTSEQFDLVIAEWMFSELYCSFSAIFNTPYAWVSTVQPHWNVLRLIDETLNPAYSADTMCSAIPPFTFGERVEQLFYQIAGSAIKYFLADKKERDVYSRLAPLIRKRGREPPAYDQLVYNASLMLGNSHVALGVATRLPQNYVNVGGYHIDTKLAPLPEDLQKLLDNAPHGVIYFSMGSNLKSKDMPDELKRSLLQMFGTLKQTVLWKFEEVLPNLPSNVRILDWAPQPSILAHPNCRLFITHGGLLSTTETVHYATPIIGIPVFADQFVNVDRAVKKGFAKRVDLSFTMASELKTAINEILQNPSYTNTVKELSFIYHHRPVPPGSELVHWVEHVIKTNGAPHLRSPALHVPFYQKFYLDLVALIVGVLYAIKTVIKRLFRKSSKKVKTN